MRIPRKAVVVLVVCLVLGAPWAWASERRTEAVSVEIERATPGGAEVFEHLWDLLIAVWSEAGCRIDPLGSGCTEDSGPEAATPAGDAGCTMDPLGCTDR
ncbi:MAG TPA: hypothetical protein VF756_20195 [Thermoanaerobaculia bacterium]